MSGEYYVDDLSGARLRRCYEIASPRVRRYLQSEIDHVKSYVRSGDTILELGCGYGRVLAELVRSHARVVGIDISLPSLELARRYVPTIHTPACDVAAMDALSLAFPDGCFDITACIQNGISAFGVDRQRLIKEAVRVTRPGGTVLFSSYSDKFWEHRLEWFERQSEEGLLGEIDHTQTSNGTIVCKDGFVATTVTPAMFRSLTRDLDADVSIMEVDESSIFCVIVLQ